MNKETYRLQESQRRIAERLLREVDNLKDRNLEVYRAMEEARRGYTPEPLPSRTNFVLGTIDT